MFDPTYPPTNADIESAPLRDQFNGLKDLIDAVPTLATAQVDSVATVNPGEPAAATATIVGDALHFTFELPSGFNGIDGTNGIDGINGEVTTNDLTNAIDAALQQTSSNSNAVEPLDEPFTNDPPTLGDLESLRNKLNELIAALRR